MTTQYIEKATVVIADTEGNEFETLCMDIHQVPTFVQLLKEYGYLHYGNAQDYKFVRAQVLSECYIYVDMQEV